MTQSLQYSMVGVMSNIAACYSDLGRDKDSLSTKRDLYARAEACNLPPGPRLQLAANLANSLIALHHLAEAKSFLQQTIRTGLGLVGPNDIGVLRLRVRLGRVYLREATSLEDLVEAEKMVADVFAKVRRVCGPSNPETLSAQEVLGEVRNLKALARANTSK